MEEKIRAIIEEQVNPVLGEHSGGAILLKYEDGIATVRLTGACSSCPSAQLTTEDVIKDIILEELPEVVDVRLDTSVSDDLVDMAKKLLRGER